MANSARAGVLVYAKDLKVVSLSYEKVLSARILHSDAEHTVLQSRDAQLIIHAIPPRYSASIKIARPPIAREEQAIKPFFTVENLMAAEESATDCGGIVWGPVWSGPEIRVRNVCDPEGNIIHLRESAA